MDDIVDSCNNTYHRSIKMAPINVTKQNSDKVFVNLYGFNKKTDVQIKKAKPKFDIDDTVRLSKHKNIFEKGYTRRWTREKFIITKIFFNENITYEVKDFNDEIIMGRFYENELQKIEI